MASIASIALVLPVNVGNVNVGVTYTLTGNNFDIASGQPYREVCKLIGDDTGIIPPEDGTDDTIVGGLLQDTTVVFANATPVNRTLNKVLPKSALNEDAPGIDEVRAVVTLTPILAQPAKLESPRVENQFG